MSITIITGTGHLIEIENISRKVLRTFIYEDVKRRQVGTALRPLVMGL